MGTVAERAGISSFLVVSSNDWGMVGRRTPNAPSEEPDGAFASSSLGVVDQQDGPRSNLPPKVVVQYQRYLLVLFEARPMPIARKFGLSMFRL